MNGLSGMSVERREAGLIAGAVLASLGFLVMAARAGAGDPWGTGAIFLVNLLALAVVAGTAVGFGPVSQPRRIGMAALAILLVVQTLGALSTWLDSTPDRSFELLWISAATAAASGYLWVRARSTFALLAVGVASLLAWIGLWDVLLSGGVAAHPTTFRLILFAAAIALFFASWMPHEEDGPELLVAAAIAAVVAAGLGALILIATLPFQVSFPGTGVGGHPASNSGIWQAVQLAITLGIFALGIRTGSRELGIVGFFSLVLFLVAAGLGIHSAGDLINGGVSGSLVFWPLALIVIGAAMTLAGLRNVVDRREDWTGALASLGAIVLASGVYLVLVRRAAQLAPDSHFKLFVYSFIGSGVLLAVALAQARRGRPAWAVAPAAVASTLAAPLTMALLVNWIDSTPDVGFVLFLIFGLSSLKAVFTAGATGSRFPLFLAGIFAIASVSGACMWIFADGIQGTTTVYRLLLIALALALARAGMGVAARRSNEAGLRIGPAGSELWAAAGFAAIVALGYGALVTPVVAGVTAGLISHGESSWTWDVCLVGLVAVLFVAASAAASRVIGLAALLALSFAVITLGTNISGNYQPAGKILVWPLVLIAGGLAIVFFNAGRTASPAAASSEPQPPV